MVQILRSGEEKADWEPLIGFFLSCLKKQKSNLTAKVEREKASDDTALPAASLQVLAVLGKIDKTRKMTAGRPHTEKTSAADKSAGFDFNITIFSGGF